MRCICLVPGTKVSKDPGFITVPHSRQRFVTHVSIFVFVMSAYGCGPHHATQQPVQTQAVVQVTPQNEAQPATPANPSNDEVTASWGNQLCPVMGNEADKNVFTVFQGKKVSFCCPSCIKRFEEHPENYLSALLDNPVRTRSLTPGSGPTAPTGNSHAGHQH